MRLKPFDVYDNVERLLQRIPEALPQLFARIVTAHVFWTAGRLRIEPGTLFTLRDGQVQLFAEEFHVPFPEVVAPLTTTLEHVLPILLILGLFSRLSAIAVAGMVLIIQFFVYPDAWWQQHSLYLAPLLFIIIRGPGQASLDHFLRVRRVKRRAEAPS